MVIPDGWQAVRLGDLGAFSKGSGIKKDDVSDSGVPCIRYGQIYTEHHELVRRIQTFVSAEVASTSRPLAAGDILFAGSGETKEEIGKCVAYVDDVGAVAGGDIIVLSPSDADPRFLGYALNAPWVSAQKMSYAQGDAVVHISATNLASVIVPMPPRAEQRAIAESLCDADALVDSLDALIAKKRDMKQAAMHQLLTGATRLGGVETSWKRRKMGDLFAFKKTTALSRAQLSADGPWGYIHYGDIHARWGTHLDLSREVLPRCTAELVGAASPLEEGDLIMADASEDLEGVGRMVEVRNIGTQDVISGLHTVVLRPAPDAFSPGFAGYLSLMPDFVRQSRTLAAGLKVYGLSKSSLATIEVAVPDTKEQELIAAALLDMDEEIGALVAQREKSALVKQGMMQELLSGRVRLV